MNKKIFKIMIALVCAFLLAFYVIKIFFPEWFVLQIENERLIEIGNFIDKHWWAYELCSIFTSFLIYWLYWCAIQQKLYLSWKEIFVVLCTIVVVHTIYWVQPQIYTTFSFLSFITLHLFSKNKNENYITRLVVATFVHFTCQCLTLQIRNIIAIVSTYNYMTLFILTLECYFWLLLMYLYFNYNKIFKKGE